MSSRMILMLSGHKRICAQPWLTVANSWHFLSRIRGHLHFWHCRILVYLLLHWRFWTLGIGSWHALGALVDKLLLFIIRILCLSKVKAHFFWCPFLFSDQLFQSCIVRTNTVHVCPLETQIKKVGECQNLIQTSIKRKPSLQVVKHDATHLSVS
jgi:hypothetical protein